MSTANKPEPSDLQYRRNVLDIYKNWSLEAIKGDLDTKRHNFSVVITNDFHDMNIGTVIRNANAFLAKEVIIVGKKKYDRRGTVGTHLYENLKHVRTVEELDFLEGSKVIGVDNVENALSIENYSWPNDHFYLVFGQEQVGIRDSLRSLCHQMVYINQYGSVRSLNVGVASGIAMYAICCQLKGYCVA
jgi:tRNA G18 (ribose-2'-O)-methylase SpoU